MPRGSKSGPRCLSHRKKLRTSFAVRFTGHRTTNNWRTCARRNASGSLLLGANSMGGRLPFSDFSSALSCLALVQRYWEVWTRKTYSRNQGRFAFSSPTPCYVSTACFNSVEEPPPKSPDQGVGCYSQQKKKPVGSKNSFRVQKSMAGSD